jgi:hypothetical protein
MGGRFDRRVGESCTLYNCRGVMDELGIRARIREMVEMGQLPCEESGKVWAGRGTGTHCAACGEPIEATQIEFEVSLGPSAVLRLHRVCHHIWQEECQALPSS